jgi:hypothetical protein
VCDDIGVFITVLQAHVDRSSSTYKPSMCRAATVKPSFNP